MYSRKAENSFTHPHFAQVPVVVVCLVLIGQLSAKDDTVLPALHVIRAHQATFKFRNNGKRALL